MTTETKKPPPLPGVEVVGRGIYLRPRQPYELKDFLLKQDNHQPYVSKETGETYLVPKGYAVNDSPPMPGGKALNQTVIEESFDRFDKQMSLDASAAAGTGLFSVDVSASQASDLRSEEEAYYALRTSFIPLWTVYLPIAPKFSEETSDMDVPVPFKHANRRTYEAFFERYGTHYVKRIWVGGKATLAFTIAKSSEMTKSEIQAGIKASYGGAGGSVNTNLQESKEKLQSSSECTVFGKGGDELSLASLSSLDEARYNEWLATIKDNPQVIELEVAGIWTLVNDAEKAKALQDAYVAANTFTPIMSMFSMDRQVYFLRGEEYFRYDIDTGESEKSRPIREKWPILSQIGFESPDAAFVGYDSFALNDENPSPKLFFFDLNKYVRLDINTGEIDEGYPKRIAEGWPGVTFDRIDAASDVPPDSIYFFKGNQYIRFNTSENRVDDGYPEPVSKRWIGVTFDRIDAAIYWGNGKVYLFRDDQHIRYDMVTYRADVGYPKFIVGTYVEDWRFFE